MKNKLTFFFSILLLFLMNCGYQPIYSSKVQSFSIGQVNIDGDKDLVNYFETQLKRFQNIDEESYDLDIKLVSTKTTISKDKKGNPSIYGLTISADIIYKQIGKNEKFKTFNQNTTYNNEDNKFDLKRYETNLEKQLINKIIEDFIFFTQSMK